MNRIAVRQLLGLAEIPLHRASAVQWLVRNKIHIFNEKCVGGKRDEVEFSALPEEVRTAYQLRLAEASGLPPGTQDSAAWIAHLLKPVGRRTLR